MKAEKEFEQMAKVYLTDHATYETVKQFIKERYISKEEIIKELKRIAKDIDMYEAGPLYKLIDKLIKL